MGARHAHRPHEPLVELRAGCVAKSGVGTVFKTPGARAAHTPGQRKTLGAESHCSRLSLTIIVPFLGENGRKSQESFEESHLSFYMK